MKNATGVGRPARPEIEKFANDVFAVARDRILAEYAGKRNQVLGRVRLTGNSGGYLPTLIKWGAERMREMILARADADVESFTLHGVPSDVRAETDLETAARQIAAGTISAIRGELDLMNARTGKHRSHPGGHLNREIEAAMRSALQEGVAGLRRQSVKAKNLSEFAAGSTGPGLSPSQPATIASGGQIRELMRRIEQWRMTAGNDGGKLTQKQVAKMMKLDLRAYSAAKKGEPRAKDHLGRIQKFVTADDSFQLGRT